MPPRLTETLMIIKDWVTFQCLLHKSENSIVAVNPWIKSRMKENRWHTIHSYQIDNWLGNCLIRFALTWRPYSIFPKYLVNSTLPVKSQLSKAGIKYDISKNHKNWKPRKPQEKLWYYNPSNPNTHKVL